MNNIEIRDNDIVYPCVWEYLVITMNEKILLDYIKEIFITREYKINLSKASKEGKYLSFVFSTSVISKEDRDLVFTTLSKIPQVKIVI